MEDKDVILEAMRKAGEPLNAGKVAELTGLDRKAVDKAFAAMKLEDMAAAVLTDEKWFLFVLEQLLGNAVKYTAKDGSGSIRIYTKERCV